MKLFFDIFQILGGLALFIYGMNIMTDGLREAAGQKLRTILSVMTTRKLSGWASARSSAPSSTAPPPPSCWSASSRPAS
jgi:hypothetical protein